MPAAGLLAQDKDHEDGGPHKGLFTNDTTDALTCVSPYHALGEHFREGMLLATVDETAGADIDDPAAACEDHDQLREGRLSPAGPHHKARTAPLVVGEGTGYDDFSFRRTMTSG